MANEKEMSLEEMKELIKKQNEQIGALKSEVEQAGTENENLQKKLEITELAKEAKKEIVSIEVIGSDGQKRTENYAIIVPAIKIYNKELAESKTYTAKELVENVEICKELIKAKSHALEILKD
jgi:hypothetical protein